MTNLTGFLPRTPYTNKSDSGGIRGFTSTYRDIRLSFGLGQSPQVDVFEVKWPTTQKIEKFANMPANQFLTIKEGAGKEGAGIVKWEKFPAAKS